ncbi:hypothetical protein RRG08_010763 [Elysia crispata]|uniref:Uncharacterized protein n=1 Tax=Elysia crispata TaxID=231223 RepID=A0AAE1A3K0_9GAST|nr:hypothetical protein RRG08_010763 [Elysia crispata]
MTVWDSDLQNLMSSKHSNISRVWSSRSMTHYVRHMKP